MFEKYIKFEATRRAQGAHFAHVFEKYNDFKVCSKVSPSLPQSVTQLAAKCDSMGPKAEMLHSAKEGYIRI